MSFTTNKEKVVFNWSSGKDSAMALWQLLKEDRYEVTHLLTTVSRPYRRISQHGVRLDLLEQQAESLGLPLEVVWLPGELTMEQYGLIMQKSLGKLISEGVRKTAFGDIFLEDLRQYREGKLAELDVGALFPIWKVDTRELANRFFDSGFKAKVVCVNSSYLDRSFTGREYDRKFVDDLPDGVDPCGENGEFHTFVYDAPIFSHPIPIQTGNLLFREIQKRDDRPETGYRCSSSEAEKEQGGLWFCELMDS